jgi:hypothetical protein
MLIYISIETPLQNCAMMMMVMIKVFYHFEYCLHIFSILYFDVQNVVGYIYKQNDIIGSVTFLLLLELKFKF